MFSSATQVTPLRSAETSDEASTHNANVGRPNKYRRVNNEDGRQRAVRACVGCRRVKEKCEGGDPCKRCRHLRRPCQFASLATPGARQRTEMSTDSLRSDIAAENRISVDANKQDLVERCNYLERIAKHHHPNLELDVDSLRQHAQRLANTTRQHTDRSRNSPSLEEGSLTLDEEKCTVDPVDESVAHYSGEFSHWNFSMRIKRHVENMGTAEGVQGEAQTVDPVPDYWRVGKLQSQSSNIQGLLQSLPPRPIVDFLVHVFFTHATSDYYFVERRWLEMKVDLIYQSASTLSTKDAGAIAIALSVFAVGCQYAHLESLKEASSTQETSDKWEPELGNVFYSQAVRLLPELIHLGSLESVQACSLLALYSLPIDASGLGYIYISLAIKLGIQNGIHRKPPGTSFRAKTIEIRNRTWWTAYCIERMLGIFHGRPVSVVASEVDADLPSLMQGDTASAEDISHFRSLVELTRHLERNLSDVALLRSGDKSRISSILSRLVSSKEELNRWWVSLELEQGLSQQPQQGESFRGRMHVRLMYCLIRMFVGRPFLLSSSRGHKTSSARPHNAADDDQSPATTVERVDQAQNTTSPRPSNTTILVQDCIAAAEEAITICRTLHTSSIGLAHSSYLEYSSCRAALLVLIAHCISNKTEEPHGILQTGLNMIREMASTGESARSEVMLIESLERALKRLSQRNEVASRGVASREDNPKIGYSQFRQWGSLWKTGSTTQEASSRQPSISASDYTTQPSSTQYGQLNYMPGSDNIEDPSPSNSTDFGNLQMAASSAFFGFEDLEIPGAVNKGQYHPERQMLDSFLSMPEYGFWDSGSMATNNFGAAFHPSDQPGGT